VRTTIRCRGRCCFNPRLERYEVNISKQQLKGAPKFSSHENWDWNERSNAIDTTTCRPIEVHDFTLMGTGIFQPALPLPTMWEGQLSHFGIHQ
jgi:hypothetical protein